MRRSKPCSSCFRGNVYKSYHGTAGPAVVKKDTKRSLYTVVKKDTKRSLHKKETSVPNENGYFAQTGNYRHTASKYHPVW